MVLQNRLKLANDMRHALHRSLRHTFHQVCCRRSGKPQCMTLTGRYVLQSTCKYAAITCCHTEVCMRRGVRTSACSQVLQLSRANSEVRQYACMPWHAAMTSLRVGCLTQGLHMWQPVSRVAGSGNYAVTCRSWQICRQSGHAAHCNVHNGHVAGRVRGHRGGVPAMEQARHPGAAVCGAGSRRM